MLQAVSETLWELLLEGSRQEETLLGNERTEAGSNQGSSLFTFYAGSSGEAAAFPQGASARWTGCRASSSPGPWTQEHPILLTSPARAWWHPPSLV